MVKVLHVLSAVNGGGVEAMLLNYYKNMDKNQVQFDFVAHKENGNLLTKDFEQLGCKVYFITSQRTSIKRNQKELKEVLLTKKYDVIHFHHGFSSFAIGMVRKLLPQSKIIVHSHSASGLSFPMKLLKPILRRNIMKNADYYCACGIMAGKYLYGEKCFKNGQVRIINNAIETERFLYNDQFNKEIKEKFNINESEKIIGTIGRFTNQKNPFFIVKIAKTLKKMNYKFKLIWVGDGPMKNLIKQVIEKDNLTEQVLLVGTQREVNKLYSAFDVFILPSKYEGLPVVSIEAQQNGCPILLSDTISSEAVLAENCKMLPLNLNIWCHEIINFFNNSARIDNTHIVREKGFDVREEACKLEDYYKMIAVND